MMMDVRPTIMLSSAALTSRSLSASSADVASSSSSTAGPGLTLAHVSAQLISTICELEASTFRLDVGTFCGLHREGFQDKNV